MNKAKLLLKSASGIVALIPGLVVVFTGLGTPPGKAVLFGGIADLVAVFVFVLLYLLRDKISKCPQKVVALLAMVFFFSGLAGIVVYLWGIDRCVVTPKRLDYQEYGPLY